MDFSPKRTADVSRGRHMSPRKTTSALSNERRNSILMTCTTQMLVVLLIGWNFLSTNQKHYQDLGSDTSSVWNFCEFLELRYSDVVL